MSTYLLYESATGYALFKISSFDELGQGISGVQSSVSDFGRFSRAVQLVAFQPFTNAAMALQQINAISECQATDELRHFLQLNLPKVKKASKAKWALAVTEPKLGSALAEGLGLPCTCTELTGEVLRGVRAHFATFVDKLSELDLRKAQLGLGHSYSRAKVKFNVHKVDNMIIQAIALLDTLDKDVNTFVMRVKEWYSWHFPELARVVPDNYQFCRCLLAIEDKSAVSRDSHREALVEILGEEDRADEVIEAAETSMGQDISPVDLTNISVFARRVIALAEFRYKLHAYLQDGMANVAPNLSTLLGEMVSARLISHAGSLTNLAKVPASTLQILGAEKALFRALKTKGNTPKYGLIFHTSFIGKAKAKAKGRISRYVANKASMAARIDAFADFTSDAFGKMLREQVEERLRFYDDGTKPRKNLEVMAAAAAAAHQQLEARDSGAGAQTKEDAEALAKKRKTWTKLKALDPSELSEKQKAKLARLESIFRDEAPAAGARKTKKSKAAGKEGGAAAMEVELATAEGDKKRKRVDAETPPAGEKRKKSKSKA